MQIRKQYILLLKQEQDKPVQVCFQERMSTFIFFLHATQVNYLITIS